MDGEAKTTRISAAQIGSMTDEAIERMLAIALTPVDPPEQLYKRLEQRLERTLEDAVAELSDIELATMRDPRNWARPAATLAIGGAAAGALVVLGLRTRRRNEDSRNQAVRVIGSAIEDVRREVERTARRTIK